jgi:hypothetical protein
MVSFKIQEFGSVMLAPGGVCVQIEAFVPIRVQRSFADGSGLGLLAIDGGYGKGIGKSYTSVSVVVSA